MRKALGERCDRTDIDSVFEDVNGYCAHCDCYGEHDCYWCGELSIPCLDGSCEICDPIGARARAARMIDRSGHVDQRRWLEPETRRLPGVPIFNSKAGVW